MEMESVLNVRNKVRAGLKMCTKTHFWNCIKTDNLGRPLEYICNQCLEHYIIPNQQDSIRNYLRNKYLQVNKK